MIKVPNKRNRYKLIHNISVCFIFIYFLTLFICRSLYADDDEIFYHATRREWVCAILEDGIDVTKGNGQNGQGFYTVTRINDYIKGMAIRGKKSVDEHDFYILILKVKDFYKKSPLITTGWDNSVTDKDYVASLWNNQTTSPVKAFETGRMPNGKEPRYDQYKGENLSTPGYDRAGDAEQCRKGDNFRAKDLSRKNAFKKLVELAQGDIKKEGDKTTGCDELDGYNVSFRITLLHSIQELTFKTSQVFEITGLLKFRDISQESFNNEVPVDIEEFKREYCR